MKGETELNTFLARDEAPKLSNTQIELCGKEITESDLYSAMKSTVNNKPPFNDGLIKEFYEIIWNEIIKNAKTLKRIECFAKASCHKVKGAL